MPKLRNDVPLITAKGQHRIWRRAALAAFSSVPVPGAGQETILDLLLEDAAVHETYQSAYNAVVDELFDQDETLSPNECRHMWRWYCRSALVGDGPLGRGLQGYPRLREMTDCLKAFLATLHLVPGVRAEQPWWLWEACTATLDKAKDTKPGERIWALWWDVSSMEAVELEPPQLGALVTNARGGRDFAPLGLKVTLARGEDPAAYLQRALTKLKQQVAAAKRANSAAGVSKFHRPAERDLAWFVRYQCGRPGHEETRSELARNAGVDEKVVRDIVRRVAVELEIELR